MSDATPKFESVKERDFCPHDYGLVFERQVYPNFSRLAISASHHGTDLLRELSSIFVGDHFYFLYVLLLSHAGRESGRYLSTEIFGRYDLDRFLNQYAPFLDGDGRHHLWIRGVEGEETLVYDRHNIIYGYGPIDDYTMLLTQKGYMPGKLVVPSPHRHGFDPKNVVFEDELMGEFEWTRSELVDGEDD